MKPNCSYHLGRYYLKSNLKNSYQTTRSLLSIPITETKAIAIILLALTRTSRIWLSQQHN
ncbi:hypothetical protein [Nostoc sp.]|uniref:hypothetical protein n=1 Tax=Nostoc sp. TaxID=1180 RepID=UPI002FFBB361